MPIPPRLLAALGCVLPLAMPPAAAQDAAVPPTPTDPPTNRLGAATSLYLRQHRTNPVHWQEWGPEALARAQREDRPIFLSIGYSACHWCHVMARESFADPAVAAVLNEHFVCIKVDREERPDLDEIYLAALQAMGQDGGWPLSAWLLPDGRPFYAGTYFPPADAHGRPGFRRVCERLAQAWREQRTAIEANAGALARHLERVLAPALPPGEPSADLLAAIEPSAAARFDAEHGGFAPPPARAPKFPSPRELQVLMRLGSAPALAMARTTLEAMARGGMFDQLGGGFHRYSTDRAWVVPHFEKMLYDNALLASCYLEASERFDEPGFAAVARATLDYMLRELQHGDGGFFASQDAQSEGEEGRFFVWTREQFDTLLGDEAELAARHFGVRPDGNWEGRSVLVRGEGAAALAAAKDLPVAAVEARLQAARARLSAARDQRVRPATDEKILAAWNGLAIAALVQGHRTLGDARYLAAAQAAAAFAVRELVVDGRCRRAWPGPTTTPNGFLDDHALLAEGLLALFEGDGDPRWLAAARALLQTVQERFGAGDGTFWYTADDQARVVARTKNAVETATPSGTAAVAMACLRAGLLLADEALYDAGVAVLRAHHELLAEAPAAAPSLVLALQFHLEGPREVVVVGPPDDARTQALLRAARALPASGYVVAHLHEGNRAALTASSVLFAGKTTVDGAPAAYVCRRGVCKAPVTDPARLGDVR
ncbi:MAG: thioredoxin domain-containing protein [Planctomycetes bacterium]|nr:thioredoxin domain-containing protein [Planctomycetota bacterium]